MSIPADTSKPRPMPYSVRVLPLTVLRLETLSLFHQQSVGHLIDQMVALNFRHAKDTGKLDEFMAALEMEEEE